MLGKKHRIRTYSAEKINEALNNAGIMPINKNEETAQVASDGDVEPKVDITDSEETTCTDCTAETAQVNDEL